MVMVAEAVEKAVEDSVEAVTVEEDSVAGSAGVG